MSATSFLAVGCVLVLPVWVGFVIAYFVELHSYREALIKEFPGVWETARAQAKPAEAWVSTAYKLLQQLDGDRIQGRQVTSGLFRARKRAVGTLYASVFLFLMFVLLMLSLDAIGGLN